MSRNAFGTLLFWSFFAAAVAAAALGFAVPMERPPYQLSHPSTFAPVMVEGGLAFLLFLLVADGRPDPLRTSLALWFGAATWASATWLNQNFVDFALRTPFALAGAAAAASCLSTSRRTPIRAAASGALAFNLTVTLFVHYVLLFPVNEQLDRERLAAVERTIASADPLSQAECAAPGFACFDVAEGVPEEVPDGDREMLTSYVPHAAALPTPVIRKSIDPRAVNTLSDYRIYAVAHRNGRTVAVMSGLRHHMPMRIIANTAMMGTLGLTFALSSPLLLWPALQTANRS